MDVPETKGSSSSGSSFKTKRSLPNYKLGKTLGFGSFGKVKFAQHVLTGHKVAIKILRRDTIDDSDEEKVRREINIMKLLSHPHVVRLYEIVETRTKIYMVMELMDCGDLYFYVTERRKLLEGEARYFFQQIISGVEYCHRNMVVHRDLKPENLLLNSKRSVKIADFGLGNFMRDGRFLKTSCGSLNYTSPEVISGQLYAGPEVDVWSCGVILYSLLCGRFPFDEDEENISILIKNIKSGFYPIQSHLSPGARDLISRILLVDPIKRITIPEIRQHPWFQEDLPQCLAMQPIKETQRVKKIDVEILQEVIKLGFHMDNVIESLQMGIQNQETVSYNLLMDNRRCDAYLMNDLQEDLPQEHMDRPEIYLKPQFPTEKTWVLGFQSRASPHETMIKFLRALQMLNVRWKRIGHYNMKCCCLSYPSSRPALGIRSPISAVKFEMQLYKVKRGVYLVDLQRIHGQPFLFLEICASLLLLLHVI